MVEWIIGKYLTRSFRSFYGVVQEEKEKEKEKDKRKKCL
jgi:hypothetical protein